MTRQLQNSFTELRSLNQDLSESETRLTQFLEALPVGVAIHDNQGQLTYLNKIGQNLLGVEGLPPIKIEQLTELFQFYQAKTQLLYPTENLPIVRALQGETVKTDDIEIRLEQEVIALEILATPIFNHQAQIAYAVSTFQDISNRKQAEEKLIYNALHDNLTTLPNRNFLLKRLEIIIKRAKRYPEYQFALLFLDLDRFKVINDSLGHLAGDNLLIDVSQKLQSIIRETDLAARLGGDEFVIVLEEIAGIQDAIQVSERIFAELQFPFFLEGKEVVVSTSIGIVLGTKDYLDPSEILRDADAAMYQAKAEGKAKYQIFNGEMHTQSLRRLHLENDLAKAIKEQEFIVYYQPIVALESGDLIGFEALVRWLHPTLGLISPVEFITIAEETGLIFPLDLLVLKQAIEQIVTWQNKFDHISSLKISVNFSVRNLRELNFVEKISQILAQSNLASKHLAMEITETVLIENFAVTIDLLRELSKQGIQISIDDFGTGYSSLTYLHSLPINNLKIDRSFINQIQPESKNNEILKAIVELSDRLNLDVIAEGVETQQQLELLKQLGCKFAQGYLFSEPVTSEAAEILIAAGNFDFAIENRRESIISSSDEQ